MARYLVGPNNNSWNFMDAVEKAQNGDTIEFEDGYVFQWPTDKAIVIKTLSRLSLLTHDRKESSAYNEGEQCKSVVFNRAFPSLYKKLDEQES